MPACVEEAFQGMEDHVGPVAAVFVSSGEGFNVRIVRISVFTLVHTSLVGKS